MTEFKQIIGRGTRLRKDKGKWHLEILDFRNATANSKTRHLTATLNHPKAVKKAEAISACSLKSSNSSRTS